VGLTCYINSHELPPLILPQVEQVLFHIHHVTRCPLPVWVGFSLHPVSSSNIVTPKSMDEFEADNTMLFVLVPLWCYHCLPVSWTVAEKESNCALFFSLASNCNQLLARTYSIQSLISTWKKRTIIGEPLQQLTQVMPSPTKFGALEERSRHWHSIFLDPFGRCCLTVIDFVSSTTELPENSQRIEEERNTRLRLVMAREKGTLELNG